MTEPNLSTTQKAQAVNFDSNQYGTFAEIGACECDSVHEQQRSRMPAVEGCTVMPTCGRMHAQAETHEPWCTHRQMTAPSSAT